ncbi:predicted protein [Nematostella vectensis]|uniref:Large ribosomal subunit protein uL29m n=1 Tax=Nematostella vectensis TaxID=45351 RepID=A7RER0_NEMVE|nr:predicted protein [Nematostella vectensis]|eukprot:XP_001641897.1 predicted protein [Nematostella vectensis]
MAAHLTRLGITKYLLNSASLRRLVPSVSRCVQTSSCVRGLEEFFPPGVLDRGELAPEKVKTGRRWRAGELRIKSNEDLHKLWYVLLKERNMLDTLMHEAKRQGVPMPSPERYHKVKKSMAMVKLVLGERERAIQELSQQQWPFDVQDPALESTSKDLKETPIKTSPLQAATLNMTKMEENQQELSGNTSDPEQTILKPA